MVYVAWPSQARLDLSRPIRQEAQRLVDLFFLGQYVLMSLMVPSFAAGTITGEKERQTYEMLLASPMRPGAIVLGKLLAALCHLAVLVFCSLPIVMLCLPLGGVSPYEVLATYVGMAASVTLFGMICVAASSYFTRTIAALVVSYLVILPLALVGILFYAATSGCPAAGDDRRRVARRLPGGVRCACCRATSRRLLHPPDVGAEAKDVVDPDFEQKTAVGMVIRSDQFPDKLFAPAKRIDLMADGVNPVFDKEMRSELFGQGTLMLRLVIQLSMLLALPLMAVCLYIKPTLGALVHLLRRVVQRAGGPGLLRRQRDQRARAADAGTAADDDRFALAHPHRQADFRAAGIVRADGFHRLAAVAGLALAAVDLLVRHADDPLLPGDHRGPDGADDDHAGHVLLGDLFADEREHDDDLRDALAAVRGPRGGLDFCPGVFAVDACGAGLRPDRHRLGQPLHLAAMVHGDQPHGCRIQSALDAWRRADQAPGAGFWWRHAASAFIAFYALARRVPVGHDVMAVPSGGGGCGRNGTVVTLVLLIRSIIIRAKIRRNSPPGAGCHDDRSGHFGRVGRGAGVLDAAAPAWDWKNSRPRKSR